MSTESPTPAFRRLGYRIVSQKYVTLLMSKTLPPLDHLFYRLFKGRISATALISGLPIVNITVVGAKSGIPRTVPLIAVRDKEDPQRLAVIASNWGQKHFPAWYFNVKANPHVTCTDQGLSGEYLAAEATGSEYDRFWGYAITAYPGYAAYKVRAGGRHLPIVVLTPITK